MSDLPDLLRGWRATWQHLWLSCLMVKEVGKDTKNVTNIVMSDLNLEHKGKAL
jgi:hypothetical protein